MEKLNKLWDQLIRIPIVQNKITEPFLHFPAGTYIDTVWYWFEDQDDNFSVAAKLKTTEHIVVCPYHG